MKIVESGNLLRIYGDDLKVFDSIPVGCWKVGFSPLGGFFLEKHADIHVTEKLYGPHAKKVQKILDAFPKFERNLGVILSGDKGIGKSICAKLVSEKAVEAGYPVIIVNQAFGGIADFLTRIEQEVVVLFDEFDKTFKTWRDENGNTSNEQDNMLTLFDGVSQGKKLFVITCNEFRSLNDFLINRPGRFHYHLRFEYPSADEVREYLRDKLNPDYYSEIEKVVAFSGKVKLNYDCLRAITYELNTGEKFEDAISDLNILHIEDDWWKVVVVLSNGQEIMTENRLDLFSDEEINTNWIEVRELSYSTLYVKCTFNPGDAVYNALSAAGGYTIPGDKIKLVKSPDTFDEDEYPDNEKETMASDKAAFLTFKSNITVKEIRLKRKDSKNYHYNAY